MKDDSIKLAMWDGYKYREKNISVRRKASDKVRSLLCSIEYLLQEGDLKSIDASKHMLDMAFQHVARERARSKREALIWKLRIAKKFKVSA